MQTDTHSNGHSTNPHAISRAALERQLARIKRPGRPSKEVLALRAQIAEIDKAGSEPESPEAEPLRKGRGKAAKTAEPVTQAISVPTITVGVISVAVSGTEPLIMHAWDVKAKRQIAEKQAKKARGPREARDPKAEYNAARYIDSQGRDCVPSRCFKNAMIEAATYLPDISKKMIRGAIYVKGDLLPIRYSGRAPVMREDMVRIGGMTKVADIRYRPEYPNWSVDLEIEFDNSVFSAEQVVNLVNRAGFNVGVGEWRPLFGRFRVEREGKRAK